LVDDDATLLLRLARALRARGLQVATASSAGEAVAIAAEEPPELAVVDLRMPGRSGLELVRDLCAMEAGIQVVVLTGYGSIATAVDAVRLGAVGYLTKPADADAVLAAFERARQDPLEQPATAFSAPSLARSEWEHIQDVLAACGGNISE